MEIRVRSAGSSTAFSRNRTAAAVHDEDKVRRPLDLINRCENCANPVRVHGASRECSRVPIDFPQLVNYKCDSTDKMYSLGRYTYARGDYSHSSIFR